MIWCHLFGCVSCLPPATPGPRQASGWLGRWSCGFHRWCCLRGRFLLLLLHHGCHLLGPFATTCPPGGSIVRLHRLAGGHAMRGLQWGTCWLRRACPSYLLLLGSYISGAAFVKLLLFGSRCDFRYLPPDILHGIKQPSLMLISQQIQLPEFSGAKLPKVREHLLKSLAHGCPRRVGEGNRWQTRAMRAGNEFN